MSLPTFFGRATAASTQHEHLAALLGELNAACVTLEQPAENAREFVELLSAFERETRAHFSAEESEGYFGTLASECPALLPTIAGLRADHTRMLEIIAELRAWASDASRGSELPGRVSALTEQFKAHERVESELVRTFLTRDPP